MTQPDPDPLVPEDEEVWTAGYFDGYARAVADAEPRNPLLGFVIVALAGMLVGALLTAAVVHAAAPRSGQTTERVDLSAPSSAALSGAPPTQAVGPVASPLATIGSAGGVPTPTPSAARTQRGSSGTASFVGPSFGARYLALPAGPGHRVRICASISGLCLERISTDAGPALFEQRAGRVADLSWADMRYLCRCDPYVVGLLKVTVTRA